MTSREELLELELNSVVVCCVSTYKCCFSAVFQTKCDLQIFTNTLLGVEAQEDDKLLHALIILHKPVCRNIWFQILAHYLPIIFWNLLFVNPPTEPNSRFSYFSDHSAALLDIWATSILDFQADPRSHISEHFRVPSQFIFCINSTH